MKNFILLAALSLAWANQAFAATTTLNSGNNWYFDGTGTLSGENTTTPLLTDADILGTLYTTFGDVALAEGDSLSYTFGFQSAGTTTSISALRFGLFNNSGDIAGAAKTNWTGFWGDNNSLQTANAGGNPFNFATGATILPGAINDTTAYDGNGITVFSLTLDRTTGTEYTLTATTFNSGVAGDTVNTFISGTIDGYAVEDNSFNTFGFYLSTAPNFTSIAVLDPVPEPSTIALLGLAGLGLILRRRRQV